MSLGINLPMMVGSVRVQCCGNVSGDRMSGALIAVDVGNSRIKLGRFDLTAASASPLPAPSETVEVPLTDRAGQFDKRLLTDWLRRLPPATAWLVASVHRGAADRLCQLLAGSESADPARRVRQLVHSDVPITVNVPAPERVGIDRLVAAAAANRLRRPGHGAIVVDHGSAITVDLVDATGAFAGGAILPGTAMAARALTEQTDALPQVAVDRLSDATPPVGDCTVAAIESGLYWGTRGAVRQLVEQIAAGQTAPPDVMVTGGGAADLAQGLADLTGLTAKHVPHLVLAGIALIDGQATNA